MVAEIDPPNGELQAGDINWVTTDTDIVSLEYEEAGEELPENMVKVTGLAEGSAEIEAVYTNGVHVSSKFSVNIVEKPEEIDATDLKLTNPGFDFNVMFPGASYYWDVEYYPPNSVNKNITPVFIPDTGSQAEAAVYFNDLQNRLYITPISGGTGKVKFYKDNPGSYFGPEQSINIFGGTSNLNALFDDSYGFGTNGIIKGQTIGLLPKFSVQNTGAVGKFEYTSDNPDYVNFTKVGKLGANMSILEGYPSDKVNVTVSAYDVYDTLMADMTVELDVDMNPSNGTVSLFPAEEIIPVEGVVGLSANVSGQSDDYEDYVRYEIYDPITWEYKGTPTINGNKYINGSAYINGMHETIIDYSPVIVGDSVGFVGIKAQACTPQGALLGTPGFCLIYVGEIK